MAFPLHHQRSSRGWSWLLLWLILFSGCSLPLSTPIGITPAQEQVAALPYFGLADPTDRVQRFAPDIFRQEMHAPPIFSPDGTEVFWSLMEEPPGVLFMKMQQGKWTDPAPAPFDRRGQGDSPFISGDGAQLLFLSFAGASAENIWLVEKAEGQWGAPTKLPGEINHNGAHWQASMADNRNLYFGSGGEIFWAEFRDGSYAQAQPLNTSFNTPDAYEGSPYIAPDESYLIFDRAPNYSNADLYISFKDETGAWAEPLALDLLNTGAHDLYANVSPDGRYLMFLSGRSGGILLPYWVDAALIENYRPGE